MFIYDEEENKIEFETAFYCSNCGKGICSNVKVDKRESSGNFIQFDIEPCSCLQDELNQANAEIKSLEAKVDSLEDDLNDCQNEIKSLEDALNEERN